MDARSYLEVLYPLQDQVLAVATSTDTEFYLSGGTAASRGYLHHRFSDDLDFFVNDDNRFQIWAGRLIDALQRASCGTVEVLQRDERFVRCRVVTAERVELKIDLLNDVRARAGEIRSVPVLGRIDSAENILANKITAALDRSEPKDLADIWGFCFRMLLSLETALQDAQGKAAGVFPADLARVLLSATESDFNLIRWENPPTPQEFVRDLHALGARVLRLA